MVTKKSRYNFDIIFEKLAELKGSKGEVILSQELEESQEINKLREIVLGISEDNEQYFSTT